MWGFFVCACALRVCGGCSVWSVGCNVCGFGCSVCGVGCSVWGVGCVVWGAGCEHERVVGPLARSELQVSEAPGPCTRSSLQHRKGPQPARRRRVVLWLLRLWAGLEPDVHSHTVSTFLDALLLLFASSLGHPVRPLTLSPACWASVQ
jgi:hypothetical protein